LPGQKYNRKTDVPQIINYITENIVNCMLYTLAKGEKLEALFELILALSGVAYLC
jgi:hypothetical protein